jgi:hypothetical protein
MQNPSNHCHPNNQHASKRSEDRLYQSLKLLQLFAVAIAVAVAVAVAFYVVILNEVKDPRISPLPSLFWNRFIAIARNHILFRIGSKV